MATVRFIQMATLAAGDRIGGGIVRSVRKSKSGLTVYIEYERSDGSIGQYRQDARTRCAIFEGD